MDNRNENWTPPGADLFSGRFGRRHFLTGTAAGAAVVLAAPMAGALDNRIVTENANVGSDAWRLNNPANDRLTQMGGYTLQDSVRPGDMVDLCVVSPTARLVEAFVFRLGWYGGRRARLMTTLAPSAVAPTPPLTTDPTTGATSSSANPSFTFRVGDDWLSGVYLVRLHDPGDDGLDAHVTFTVKDDRRSDLIFSQPILTYAAYTDTPRGPGKSLYDGASGGSPTSRGTQRATEVSLDRPYRNSGSGDLLRYDHDLLSWLEREGYDVSYVTNLDIDREPGTIQRGRVAVISGHDEYWTQQIMDAYLAARDAGVHIANLGANNAYWRVRLDSGPGGRQRRQVICFKYAIGEQSTTPTVLFRDTETPMQDLLGLEFMDLIDFFDDYPPIVPTTTSHWFWEGTGAAEDQPLLAPIMGYEVDRRDFSRPLPANLEYRLLASSPFDGSENGRNWCHSVLYRAPSGAWVFSGGTTSWAWGLIRPGFRHSAIERATHNLLRRMLRDSGGTPPPPVAGFEPFSTAEAFVEQQYLDFLGRSADAAGRSFWVGEAGSGGANRAAVIDRFLRSAEFENRFMIARLYLAAFRRLPDPGGYEFWIAKHDRDRWSLVDLATFFASSDEFRTDYGTPDDRAFVRHVYRNIFGRNPDAEGWDYWTNRLRVGLSRGALLASFSDSPEGRTIFEHRVYVVAAHQGMLRRPPTPSEDSTWTTRLDEGTSPLALLETLLASGEYAARF